MQTLQDRPALGREAFSDPLYGLRDAIKVPAGTIDADRIELNREVLQFRAMNIYRAIGERMLQWEGVDVHHLEDTGRWSGKRMRAAGVRVDEPWAGDIAAALVEGSPTVIRVGTPYPDLGSIRYLAVDNMPALDDFLQISGLMRTASDAAGPATRFTVEINDYGHKAKAFTHTEITEDIARRLHDEDVLRVGDVPGVHASMLSLEYEGLRRFPHLLRRLEQSGGGELITDGWGTHFRPHKWVADAAGRGPGIIPLIASNGVPLESAVRAASYIHEDGDYNILGIYPYLWPHGDYNSKISPLMRALGVLPRDRYEHIGYHTRPYQDSVRHYTPSIAMAQMLRAELKHIHDRLEATIPYDAMRVYDYSLDSYGRKHIIAEDVITIDWEQRFQDVIADCLGVDLDTPETLLGDNDIVHVGLGPNLFPVMLSQIFTKGPTTRIDGREYTEAGRTYIEEFLANKLPEPHDRMWNKFENHMVAGPYGSDRFVGAVQAVRDKLDIQYGDIFDMPSRKHRMVRMDFVAESVVPRRRPFWQAMRSVAESLQEEDSVLVARLMKNSHGWFGHEATPIDEQTVVQVCADVGLEVLFMRDASEQLPEDQKLRPEDGMMLLIARPRSATRPLSRQSQRLIDEYALAT
jgi:hypothetical protein